MTQHSDTGEARTPCLSVLSQALYNWATALQDLDQTVILFEIIGHSSQLSMKFIMLINVKMPTIVGILTFISRINTTSESLKAKLFYI